MTPLIKGISRVLQKLLKDFNGATIFSFIMPFSLVSSKSLAGSLNTLESAMGFFLANLYDIAINLQLFLRNYHCILLNYTSAYQHRDLVHYCMYYHINLRSSEIFSLFSGGIHLSLRISFSLSLVSELFCGEFIEVFVILSAI